LTVGLTVVLTVGQTEELESNAVDIKCDRPLQKGSHVTGHL
jgi:hypothetical protein